MSVGRLNWLFRRAAAAIHHRVHVGMWNFVAFHPKYGSLFQPVDDFLSGSTQAYQYVQNELCTAENVRHLREACSESVYEAIQESSTELEEWRRENGDKSGMIFDIVEPYFQEIQYPENFESASSITASVTFYAQVQHRIDGFDFKTEWDPQDGTGEWKIVSIF